MDTTIRFEDHSKRMRKLPIIFHRNCHISSKKMEYINWHENIEILRITQGEGSVACGKELLDAAANDIFVINANIAHGIISGSFIQYDCMIVDRSFALDNGMDTNKLIFERKIKDPELLTLFDHICDVVAIQPQPLLLDINAALLPFLCMLYHKYARMITEETAAQKESDPIQTALVFIKENLNKPLTLETIAEAAGISKYHFARKFRDITGFSPMEYVNFQRCELAKTLIAEKGYTIKQIAHLTGFENSSYFSKVFLNITGTLPSKYK